MLLPFQGVPSLNTFTQGIALGIQQAQPTPYRGKRITSASMLLPFQGVPSLNTFTQGDALG
jgi:hypothetical protein